MAASSSGQLLPPVMGAAAFIMADFTGIPYLDIVKSAAIPALLSYTAILFMVHLEASKHNLTGIPRKELVSPFRVFAGRGYLLLPIIAIIVCSYCGLHRFSHLLWQLSGRLQSLCFLTGCKRTSVPDFSFPLFLQGRRMQRICCSG